MTELTPRQQAILRMMVRTYVESAAPIGSKTLVEKYGLDVSTATVRNELAQLEDLGYLTHPHTSAGRIPTVQGYQYFVERLMTENELPPAERRMITHQFHQARPELEQWMPLAATVLARTSQGAALVTAPRADQSRYKHMQLLSTHGRSVLLVLVLEGGQVRQQMLSLAEPYTQNTLSEVADRLNQLCAGLTADEIEQRVEALPPLEADLADLVLDLLQRSEGHSSEVYRDGLSDVLRAPEFVGSGSAHGLLRVLEEHSFLEAVLADALSPIVGGVRVLIGGEGRWEELGACSLVLARYGVSGYATGALGVVGPTRMHYGRAVSAVRYVAGLMSELVHYMYEG